MSNTRNTMKRTRRLLFGAAVVGSLSIMVPAVSGGGPESVHWPGFRGVRAGGVADGDSLPVKWDVASGEHVKWETPIPGLAHSSPIIWGERIFVTTAVSADPNPYLRVGLYGESPKHEEKVEHQFRVYCVSKKTGAILWERTAHRGIPKAQRHIKATQVNCTPATDGKHVVAMFGSEGLYCYDMEGTLLWKKDFGYLDSGPPSVPDLQWGFASSPIIHEGKVIVLCAVRKNAFITALRVTDGSEIWKTAREPYPGWCTPTVHVGKGRSQIIVNGYKHIGGYDLETGSVLWKMHGGGDIPVPTPIVAHDLIFITNAHGGQAPMCAVRTTATGDITLNKGETSNAHVAWVNPHRGNYMQTPLVYGDYLYGCRDNGILTCFDAKTGKTMYRKRLTSGVGFSASPVAGDGKIYFTSEEGEVYVIGTGPAYELLARNELGEICMATPAISAGTLFFRTKSHLIAIGG